MKHEIKLNTAYKYLDMESIFNTHSQSTQVNVYYRTLGSIWSFPVLLF